MKKIKILILILICSKIAYSQKTIKYHYVLNEHISVPDSLPLFSMEQEFTTGRKYFGMSKFSESRLFTGDSNKSILFNIHGEIWYYKKKNKWNLFYNYNKMVGGVISLFGLNYQIKFKEVVKIRNLTLHKIILEPIGIIQTHKLEYYFNYLKGVVIIKTSGGNVLLRADSFEYSLTNDEIDIL